MIQAGLDYRDVRWGDVEGQAASFLTTPHTHVLYQWVGTKAEEASCMFEKICEKAG